MGVKSILTCHPSLEPYPIGSDPYKALQTDRAISVRNGTQADKGLGFRHMQKGWRRGQKKHLHPPQYEESSVQYTKAGTKQGRLHVGKVEAIRKSIRFSSICTKTSCPCRSMSTYTTLEIRGNIFPLFLNDDEVIVQRSAVRIYSPAPKGTPPSPRPDRPRRGQTSWCST